MTPDGKRPPSVLIAEDDDSMRRLLVEEFARDGWDVRAAVDGIDLLDQLGGASDSRALHVRDRWHPDLIISDERMPRMCGLEVLRTLAAAGARVPFILMTGFGEPELHARAERLGASMTLDKPVPLDVLLELARTIVAGGAEPIAPVRRISILDEP